MTVSTTANRVVGIGNGATTVWNYSFIIPNATQAVVQITDRTTGAVTTLTAAQYSITGINNPVGGTVTYSPALTTNQTITIQRIVPLTQVVDLDNQGAFYPTVVEGSLDYLTMITQQLSDSLSRAFVGSPNGVLTVPMGGYRLENLGAPVNPSDSARISDVQAAQAVANAVPTPILADVGKWLKATAVGNYAWTTMSIIALEISDATAAGIALLTGANAAAQRTSLGLGSLATLSTVTSAEVSANTLTFADFQRTGSVGQVWQSNGAGADPSYVGSMTLLASGTVSAVATLDLTLPSGYKLFKLFLNDYRPVTNAVSLCWRVSVDNGATYISTANYGYVQVIATTVSAGAAGEGHATSQAQGIIGYVTDNSANGINSVVADVWPATATSFPTVLSVGAQLTGAAYGVLTNFGTYGATGRITNIRLYFSSGNIQTATYALYGVI